MSLKDIFKSRTPGKTVFILGAGFSRAAGYPLQADILDNLNLKDVNSFMDTPTEVLSSLPYLREYNERLESFLQSVFHGVSKPTLEDIFTTLDQTIYEKGHCKGYDWQELVDIDTQLKSTILFSFHSALAYASEKDLAPYRTFSSQLMRARREGIRKFSIISLNWDSLLEESVYWCIRKARLEAQFDVDFCCFTNPIGKNSVHTPSLTQKSQGIQNLKLHGSSNWLICYSCKRLYTGISSSENVSALYGGDRTCPSCTEILEHKRQNIPELKPFIITPTYLKTFPNSHIQNVWDNAQIELLEADRVVFLGYSLPEADYFVRSLFRRTIDKAAKIDVVLLGKDKKYSDTVDRYRAFFPRSSLSFYKSGMAGFFSATQNGSTEKNLSYLKKTLSKKKMLPALNQSPKL